MSDRDSPAPEAATETLHDGVDEVPKDNAKDLGDYDTARAGDSDRESDILSDVDEVDEDQFDEYDASAANIDERPVEIDEDVARTLKASKRKGTATKKPKEGKREKKRRDRTDDALDAGDTELYSGKRVRKTTTAAAEPVLPEPENEENLTPEERRMRAIERASRKEVKKPSQRRKRKDEEDLEDELDDVIASLKIRMERACEADNVARGEGQPAIHKLKLLPEVMALLNRNNNQAAVVDPDTNFLQHVKFFLEPLNDGSLPAYNIQRDIFTALMRLPIDKECLLSSGIGKVVLFYTKSKRPELLIKRMAEKLIGEWSRPILKRTHDYRKRHVESRDYDYQAAKLKQQTSSQFTLTQRPATQNAREAERERMLAPASTSNRARVVGLPSSYTIAPRSTFDATRGPDHRPIGASGMEAFRKMTTSRKKKA
ncbi:transcription factor SPN1 [Microdochium nivale]|nr:transcription factor SPN1 [Microdochium nivale]